MVYLTSGKLHLIPVLVLTAVFLVLFVNCGGDDDPVGSSGNDAALIGTWNLQSVNSQEPIPGVWLKWVFTATTITSSSDLDCVTVTRYTAAGGKVTAVSLISSQGSQCGDDHGIGESWPYSLNGNTLTVTFTDPELDPPVAVFVMMRG
jgi:hypothetical protein